MSGPCVCWLGLCRLHEGHCCVAGPGLPTCHKDVATAIRNGTPAWVALGIPQPVDVVFLPPQPTT